MVATPPTPLLLISNVQRDLSTPLTIKFSNLGGGYYTPALLLFSNARGVRLTPIVKFSNVMGLLQTTY